MSSLTECYVLLRLHTFPPATEWASRIFMFLFLCPLPTSPFQTFVRSKLLSELSLRY